MFAGGFFRKGPETRKTEIFFSFLSRLGSNENWINSREKARISVEFEIFVVLQSSLENSHEKFATKFARKSSTELGKLKFKACELKCEWFLWKIQKEQWNFN